MTNDIHSAGISTAVLDHPSALSHQRLVAPVRVPGVKAQVEMNSRLDDKDRQILAHVLLALHHCGYEQLRRVRTRCRRGQVVLQGSISTYYLKQVAQEIVSNLSDVQSVKNDLRVQTDQ